MNPDQQKYFICPYYNEYTDSKPSSEKIAHFHEKVANARRDWHFKLAHYLCDQLRSSGDGLADNIFVEDIDFNSWSKGLFGKQSLDSGIGGFINDVLPFVCWKQGKYYLKVDKNGTSQECSNCHAYTEKKELSERVHCKNLPLNCD